MNESIIDRTNQLIAFALAETPHVERAYETTTSSS